MALAALVSSRFDEVAEVAALVGELALGGKGVGELGEILEVELGRRRCCG